MKRLLSILVIISLILSTTACAPKTQETDQTIQEEEEQNSSQDALNDEEELEEAFAETVEELEEVEEELTAEDDEDQSKDDEPAIEEEEKEKAIDFTLKDLDGNEVSLSDFLGKKVVLAFWDISPDDSNWESQKPTFETQFAEFEKLQEEVEDDVVILTVVNSTDESRFTTILPSFIKDYDFITLIDDTPYNIAYRVYGLMVILNVVLIDSEGYIHYIDSMSNPEQTLSVDELKALINEME